MKVLPTLQIRQGRLVPQLSGAEGGDPSRQVEELLACGCTRLTLVDVDAARGLGHNRELIASILRRTQQWNSKVCVQVGGGIRGSDQAQYYLDRGATWLLVGTLLYRMPMVVEQLLARFHDHLTAALDARGGVILTTGWEGKPDISVIQAAQLVRSLHFKRVLFVDTPRGEAPAPDFHSVQLVAEHSHVPTFMWGPFRDMDDLKEAARIPGLHGLLLDADFALDHATSIKTLAVNCS